MTVTRLLLGLDPLVDLFPVYGNILRSVDADADLVAFDRKRGNGDLVADHDGFAGDG